MVGLETSPDCIGSLLIGSLSSCTSRVRFDRTLFECDVLRSRRYGLPTLVTNPCKACPVRGKLY